jgi:HlyD family secretion protein
MSFSLPRWLMILLIALGVGVLAYLAWERYGARKADAGIVSGNGRIEAVEIDVATKAAGRLKDVKVHEGALVTAGQVIALMDTRSLQAQLKQAEAQVRQAETAVASARSQLIQRQGERAAAQALVTQRQSELQAERKRAARIAELVSRGDVSQQSADDARTAVESDAGALAATQAQLTAADAAIATARSQIVSAQATVDATRATVAQVQTEIDDSVLKAPRDGRVQVVVARSGEVLGPGGRVVNLVDLTDVYMTFFLPAAAAGIIGIGAEVRVVLDAAPQYVLPAKISFVADVAQFTPKTVETASEREKLMFRVRAQLPADLLRNHIAQVKTGVPGVAYVRLDPAVPWPAKLQVNVTQ